MATGKLMFNFLICTFAVTILSLRDIAKKRTSVLGVILLLYNIGLIIAMLVKM